MGTEGKGWLWVLRPLGSSGLPEVRMLEGPLPVARPPGGLECVDNFPFRIFLISFSQDLGAPNVVSFGCSLPRNIFKPSIFKISFNFIFS